MKKLYLLSVWLLLTTTYGCSSGGKEDIPEPPPTPVNPTPSPETPTPEIKVTTSIPEGGLTCKSDSTSQSITFTTNTDWTLTVEKGDGWCTPSVTSGESGEITIIFTLAPNENTEERKATITIKADTATQTFTIHQEGKPQENPDTPGNNENQGTGNSGTGNGSNPNGTVGNMNWG